MSRLIEIKVEDFGDIATPLIQSVEDSYPACFYTPRAMGDQHGTIRNSLASNLDVGYCILAIGRLY